MKLPVKKYASLNAHALPIVLVHGWGIGSSIWSNCIKALTQEHPVYVVDMPGYVGTASEDSDAIDPVLIQTVDHDDGAKERNVDIEAHLQLWECELPPEYLLVGFSLGGAIASVLLPTLFRGARGLVTISTNALFVAEKSWSNAIDPTTFSQFLADLESSPNTLMKRFCMLQSRGSAREKRLRKWLLELQGTEWSSRERSNPQALIFGLEALQMLDLRDCWSNRSLPLLHQFGANDSLVPIAAASDIENQCGGKVEIFMDSGHLPFVSEQNTWVNSIFKFVRELDRRRGPACKSDHKKVEQSKGNHGETYGDSSVNDRAVDDLAISIDFKGARGRV